MSWGVLQERINDVLVFYHDCHGNFLEDITKRRLISLYY
jgi:hypothetical protein